MQRRKRSFVLHSSRGCGRTRGHGPTCSSEVLHGNQAGIRNPDRPSTPTTIASSFDYQVIFCYQAPHERLLRHRLRPDLSDLFALDCHPRGGDLHQLSSCTTLRPSPKAKYSPVRRRQHGTPIQTTSPLPSAGLFSSASSTSRAQGSLHALLWRFPPLQVHCPRFSYRYPLLYGHHPAGAHLITRNSPFW